MDLDAIRRRSAERRRRAVVGKAASFAEADAWDLAFWQARSPEQRLEAFLALRQDVETVLASRRPPDGAP